MLRRDALLAAALLVVAELELVLRPGDGSEVVTALLLPVVLIPLAWRRVVPLLPLLVFAVMLPLQAALDGLMIAHLVAPLLALVVALYTAGRHIASPRALALAGAAVVAIVGSRVGFDPAARHVADAVMTLIATSLPLLVGRWARGQSLLQHEHSERAERLERDRERDTRQAADEERVRIATDLQAAIAGGLGAIVRRAGELDGLIRSDPDRARDSLTTIAATAREALADVRRVLGILRRDEAMAPTAPSTAPGSDPSPAAGSGEMGSGTEVPVPEVPVPAGKRGQTPFRFDGALVAVLVLGALVELGLSADPGDRAAALLTGVLIPLPLLARRTHAVAAALAAIALIATQSLITGLDRFPVADIATVVCGAYAVGAYASPRYTVPGLVALLAADGAHAALFFPEGIVIALFGGVAVPWTIGRIVRAQRRLTDEKRAAAAEVEASRERDAEAAVIAERMRVARELHDAVAHNVSVIAIQAAGADGVVEKDPARAAECAVLIGTVAREALTELGRLVDTGQTPQPGLHNVADLAQRARDGGLPVDLRIEGDERDVPAGVDLAAFRIVQEALANTSKHAGHAHASITVRYTPRELDIQIADDGHGRSTARIRNGTGHGLVGMRERVALYGGTFEAGPRDEGGFQVHARLPIAR